MNALHFLLKLSNNLSCENTQLVLHNTRKTHNKYQKKSKVGGGGKY